MLTLITYNSRSYLITKVVFHTLSWSYISNTIAYLMTQLNDSTLSCTTHWFVTSLGVNAKLSFSMISENRFDSVTKIRSDNMMGI